MKEYQENKQDRKYIKAKSEFQYLHEKLAHIKKIVHDYDTRPGRSLGNPTPASAMVL